MFLGHFGLGFAGKRVAPELSLGALFLAVQWADLLFFVFCLLGIEHFRIDPGNTRMTPMDFYDYSYTPSSAPLFGGSLLVYEVRAPSIGPASRRFCDLRPQRLRSRRNKTRARSS